MTSSPQSSHSKRQALLRQVSVPSVERSAPPLSVRWLYAKENTKKWAAFGALDNRALEAGWKAWKEENGGKEGDDEGEDEKKGEKEKLKLEPIDADEPLPSWRVPVMQDKTHEVDLRRNRLAAAFYKSPEQEVMRAEWFYDSSTLTPCTADMGSELEELYAHIEPWTVSYSDELRSSVALGTDAEDKLKCPLDRSLKGSYVIFLGPGLARLYTQSLSTRISKTLWTAVQGEHGGGTLLVRGFPAAAKLIRARNGDSSSASKLRASGMEKLTNARDSLKRRSVSGAPSTPESVTATNESTDSLPEGAAKPSVEKPVVEPPPSKEDAALFSGLTSKFGSWKSMLGAAKAANAKEEQKVIDETEAEREDEEWKGRRGGVGQEEEEEEDEYKRELAEEEQKVDLVFVCHGIGQRLASVDGWGNLDFTLAVKAFQALVDKRASMPSPADIGGDGLRALMDNRRVVFLPLMWRATLEDFEPEATDEEEGFENNYTLDDIMGEKDSIPLVRQLIQNVLLDIPLYLSHHRPVVINRLRRECNRLYRLFCARNPNFEKLQGRTHMICHSLGAALAFDILSEQQTKVPPLYTRPKDMLITDEQLVFNTSSLFLAGSPAALFLWLHKAPLVARRGRTSEEKDESIDRAGKYGCLAVDRVSNCFFSTDPIGTRLNGTVDAKAAKGMKSLDMARATKSILRELPGAIAQTPAPSSFFGTWSRSKATSGGGAAGGMSSSSSSIRSTKSVPDLADSIFGDEGETPKGVEASDGKRSYPPRPRRAKGDAREDDSEKEADDGSENAEIADKNVEKEEEEEEAGDYFPSAGPRPGAETKEDLATRRFKALNPLGSIDFKLPFASTGMFSHPYIDLLYSHAAYWHSADFAEHFIASVFADDETLKRAAERLRPHLVQE